MTLSEKSKYDKRKFYKLLKSGHFAEMVKESTKNAKLNASDEVYNVIKPMVAQEPDVEQFWVIFLNSRNKILEMSCMFKGSITSASVYPRELVKKIISNRAAAIICCHNHPSGDPAPSREDYALTFQILVVLRSMGTTLHEHMILGNGAYHSMADHGDMARFNQKYERLMREA